MENENTRVEQLIENRISDLASDFLFYDRKGDELLPMDKLNDAVISGKVTAAQMAKQFEGHLNATFDMIKKIKS